MHVLAFGNSFDPARSRSELYFFVKKGVFCFLLVMSKLREELSQGKNVACNKA